MKLYALFMLTLKARVLSWLTGIPHFTYVNATLPSGYSIQVQMAEFRDGRMVKETAPSVPDFVPQEWVPERPEDLS